MRKRAQSTKVRLNSLNHKINRKAMLAEGANRAHDVAYSEENWVLADAALEAGMAYEEYFEETLRTPVGGYVSRYLVGTYYQLPKEVQR